MNDVQFLSNFNDMLMCRSVTPLHLGGLTWAREGIRDEGT